MEIQNHIRVKTNSKGIQLQRFLKKKQTWSGVIQDQMYKKKKTEIIYVSVWIPIKIFLKNQMIPSYITKQIASLHTQNQESDSYSTMEILAIIAL